MFCYLPQLSTKKESLRFKGSVTNTGALFSAPDDKNVISNKMNITYNECFLNTFQFGKNTESKCNHQSRS